MTDKNTKTTDETVRKLFEDYGPAIGDALTQAIRSNTATSDVDADLKAAQATLAIAQTDHATAQTITLLLAASKNVPVTQVVRLKQLNELLDRVLTSALDGGEDEDEDEDEPEAPVG